MLLLKPVESIEGVHIILLCMFPLGYRHAAQEVCLGRTLFELVVVFHAHNDEFPIAILRDRHRARGILDELRESCGIAHVF